jgi:hypothetical protein
MRENGKSKPIVPSELSILTDLYTEETDKEAIRHAYYNSANGDPQTHPVQFAVLLTANAQLLKSYPERLQKLLETETKRLADAIIAQQAPIKTAAATFERSSLLSSQLVQKLEHAIDAHTRIVSDERKANAQEWSKRVSDLDRQAQDIRYETSKLLEWKSNLMVTCIAIAAAVGLVVGILATLAFQRFILNWPTL